VKWLYLLGAIVLVYGVAQPGILRAFHVHAGEDLKVADVLSVLLAVLGLAATSVGILVYSLVKQKLEDGTWRSETFTTPRSAITCG
jgi:hypothetical protein